MNFIEKIRSCFWQDDLRAPNQRENPRGVDADEPVSIDSEEQRRKIQELKEEAIEMMIPVNMMNKTFWSFLDDIVKAAEELNIQYSLVDNIAYCEGKAKDVERFETLLEKLHRMVIKGEKKRNIYLRDDDDDFPQKRNNWDDKNFVIPLDFTREDVDVVLYKAKKKELKFRFKDNVLKVRGNIFEVSIFSEWLEEFTKTLKKQKQKFKGFLEKLKLETITEKIQILPFDDLQKQDILKKALVLEIKCIFDEDNSQVWEISGRADRMNSFKNYIQATNPMFPRDLYPKYWDFDIKDDYAEIEVSPTSEEFNEIKSKISGSFSPASLNKLKRIQNQGLMNNYLTMIHSEKRKDERRLLFYGTETQEPEKIYRYSKTGFDVSYASFKGRFGGGLYFPISALYTHGYGYESRPKIFQVLVADVFVGEALQSSETNQNFQNLRNKILKGYDSLVDRDNFYVIYKNSQSYPLYLVEYTLQVAGFTFLEDVRVKKYEDDYEYEYEDDENKLVDLKLSKEFECPLELSPLAQDALKMQIEMLNLTLVETNGSRIKVIGNRPNIETFSQWLNEFFYGLIMGENKIDEIRKKKYEKIAFSMLYNLNIAKMMMKASKLKVDCLLSNNKQQMSLTGLPKNLESFKAYLHKINLKAKKYLFPKYWDFSILQPHSEIEIGLGSEEFQEISKIFNYGFENAQVSRLIRIQNYDLFNKYIRTICSKTEVGPDTNLQRKLLFYRAGEHTKREISRISEIGFNMQSARTDGKYGRGIYFSTNSSDSHSFLFPPSRSDTFQMLIADVYTGLSSDKKEGHPIKDHDSLFSNEDNLFVLYKNFQSYPLYFVEYTSRDPVYPDSQMKQKHVTNILSGGQYCLDEYIYAHLGQQLDPLSLQRIEKEFKNANKDEFIRDHFLVDNVEKSGNIEWLVSFKGFKDTQYEGGLFKIKIVFPANYPMKPPFIKFLTQIYHPSINEQGIPCLGLLSTWTPATEIRHILLSISCLLHDPLMEDPLMPERLALFKSNPNRYMKMAREWTLKYANGGDSVGSKE